MQDRQEKAWKNIEAGNQAAVSDRTSGEDPSSGGKHPHGLTVTLPNLVGAVQPTGTSGGTPASSPHGTKRPLDDDAEEIAEIPDRDEPAGPPKKKKKKKKKNKDASRDEVPDPEDGDDELRLSTSTTEPGVAVTEPTPVPDISVIPEEDEEAHKKKKKNKKDASHEKWKVEQQEAIAK